MPPAHEHASTQTAVRNIMVWILECSEAFADSILDKMQVRGYVRFDGTHCVFNPDATESPGGVAMSDNEAKCLK